MSLNSDLKAAGLDAAPAPAVVEPNPLPRYVRNSLLFVLVGLLVYLVVFFAADQIVYRYAKRNRFFDVKTAPRAAYDTLILGASHAAVFDYQDMNAQLEQRTGLSSINLSEVGAGVVVNRLLLDYFLAQHTTRQVIYFADSFAFYSADWNENRLEDVRLFDRAPFDPALVKMLWQNPAGRSIALNYTIGFSKINNPDRFKPDVTDDEALRFEKTVYRPVAQIDKQRIDYLYPKTIEPAAFEHYMTEFEDMVRDLQARGVRVVVIKPPIPVRMYNMLPDEARFDAALKPVLARNAVEFYDFSLVNNDEKYFFNPDHLNKAGVLAFYDGYLANILRAKPAP